MQCLCKNYFFQSPVFDLLFSSVQRSNREICDAAKQNVTWWQRLGQRAGRQSKINFIVQSGRAFDIDVRFISAIRYKPKVDAPSGNVPDCVVPTSYHTKLSTASAFLHFTLVPSNPIFALRFLPALIFTPPGIQLSNYEFDEGRCEAAQNSSQLHSTRG